MIITRLPVSPSPVTKEWGDQLIRAIDQNLYSINGDLSTYARERAAMRGWIVNVRSYGAKGDGSADDTLACQAAITAGAGKVVWFPPGIYKVGTLTLTQNCTVIGSGPQNTFLLCRTNNTKIFNFLAGLTNAVRFSIGGMTFLCIGTTGCQGVSIDGNTSSVLCTNIRIADIGIEGTFDYGINLRYCQNSYLSNILCVMPTVGFYINNCGDTDMYGCRANLGSSYAFDVLGGPGATDEGVRMVNCAANTQGFGLRISGQEWGTAASCSWTTCAGGALIADNSAAWKFAACEFSVAGTTPANTGVILGSGTTRFSFSSCQFSNNTIGISAGGSYHQIASSILLANSGGDIVLPDTLYSTVIGNNCDSSGGGILDSILETGTANFNALTGNTCQLLVTRVGASSTSTGNVVY